MIGVLRTTFSEFMQDECPRLAAALAYYTLFALPAMLVLIISIASLFVDRREAVAQLRTHFEETMGREGSQQVSAMIKSSQEKGGGVWQSVLGTVALLYGATGMLGELQTALNRAWGVKAAESSGVIQTFLFKRVVSLGMLLAFTFMLIVSLTVSGLIARFGDALGDWAPQWLSTRAIWATNELVSLAIFTVLFAAILKFVPDARLAWSDVWAGGFFTAVLFSVGKFLLGLYLGWSNPTSAFGAAGSLALILLWIYYSGMILFLGAEFTQARAREQGRRIAPEPGAASLGNAAKAAG